MMDVNHRWLPATLMYALLAGVALATPTNVALATPTNVARATPVAADSVPRGPLPRNVELRETALELKIDPGQERLQGVARIAVNVLEATPVLWLHGRDLVIASASITAAGSTAQPIEVQLRQWLDENFDQVAERVAPTGAGLVGRYSAGACSNAEADTLQRKFEGRLRGMEGGPRLLAQVVEAVRQCGALREAHAGTLGKGPF